MPISGTAFERALFDTYMFTMGASMGIILDFSFRQLYTQRQTNWKVAVLVGLVQLFINSLLYQRMRDMFDDEMGFFLFGLTMPQALLIQEIVTIKSN